MCFIKVVTTMYVPCGSPGIYKNLITCSINDHESNTYYVPGYVLGTRDLTRNNKHSLLGVYILVGRNTK